MTRRGVVTVFLLILVVAGACGDDPFPRVASYNESLQQVRDAVADSDEIDELMEGYYEDLAGASRPVAFDGGGCGFRKFEVVARQAWFDSLTTTTTTPAATTSTLAGGTAPSLTVPITTIPTAGGITVVGRIGNFYVLDIESTGLDALAFATMHGAVNVMPHYVLFMNQEYKWGPGGPPIPIEIPTAEAYPLPDVGEGDSRVVVFDVSRRGGDDRDGDDYIDPVAGHGDFVASIIQRETGSGVILVDPRATDGITDLLSFDVAATAFVRRVPEVYSGSPFVINLSFGTAPCDGLMPAEVMLAEVMMVTIGPLLRDGSLVVASAGNSRSSREHFPAALSRHSDDSGGYSDRVISVGALEGPQGPAAHYSNCGDWVTAWADGSHQGPYPEGSITYTRQYDITAVSVGAVEWAGTSFAAPVITGTVAKELDPTPTLSSSGPRDVWVTVRGDFEPQRVPTVVGEGCTLSDS